MLVDDLTRLAERGPRRAPEQVIATAFAEAGLDDAEGAGSDRSRWLMVAATAAAVLAGAITWALGAAGDDRDEAVPAASGTAGPAAATAPMTAPPTTVPSPSGPTISAPDQTVVTAPESLVEAGPDSSAPPTGPETSLPPGPELAPVATLADTQDLSDVPVTVAGTAPTAWYRVAPDLDIAWYQAEDGALTFCLRTPVTETCPSDSVRSSGVGGDPVWAPTGGEQFLIVVPDPAAAVVVTRTDGTTVTATVERDSATGLGVVRISPGAEPMTVDVGSP